MDTQDPPTDHAISLLGLDNEKDAVTLRCLDRKEVWCAT